MIPRHVIDHQGGELHLLAQGLEARDTPALLLLHQVPSSGWMWREVMSRLPAGLACIAPDLPGYGESTPPRATPSLEGFADAALAGARALHPGPFVVVGHHTGALVALVSLAREPERVRGVLGLGLPWFADWPSRFERFARLSPMDPDADPGQLQALWTFTSQSFDSETPLATRLRVFADRLAAGPCWYHGYVALYGYDVQMLAGRLAGLRERIDLVALEQDRLSSCAGDAERDLGVTVERMPGGPWVTVERPGAVAERLLGAYRRFCSAAAHASG